jgi:hypothetical protein
MHSMRLSMDGQALPLVLAMGACVIVFIVSLFTAPLASVVTASGRRSNKEWRLLQRTSRELAHFPRRRLPPQQKHSDSGQTAHEEK